MKNELYFYLVTPSVFRVGAETDVTVTPLDPRYAFEDGGAYTAALLPLTRNVLRFSEEPFTVRAEAKDGRLHFRCTLDREEAYYLRLYRDGKRLVQLSVYALAPDLFALRPLKGDTHAHSCRSDGRESPAVVAANYRGAGFDFLAVTDHHRYAPSLEAIDAYRDVPPGITLLTGEEVHSPETYLHIVHIGGTHSVNEIFQQDKDRFYREVAELDRTEPIPFTDADARFVYASALWCVREIRRAGGLAIFPHPYWISNVFNVPDDMVRALILDEVFDAFELVGGQSTHENNFQTQMYYHLREEYLAAHGCPLRLPILGASDSHGTIGCGLFDRKFSVVLAPSRAPEDILAAIREGNTAAAEVFEDDSYGRPQSVAPWPHYNVHGSARLAPYARFLCENYFPRTRLFAAVEGELMREYLLGVPGSAELLRARAGAGDDFYEIFFGKKPFSPSASL